MILCPHCEEPGCSGACRFRASRRSFLAMGLGALAASALPASPVLRDVWADVPMQTVYVGTAPPAGESVYRMLVSYTTAPGQRVDETISFSQADLEDGVPITITGAGFVTVTQATLVVPGGLAFDIPHPRISFAGR